MKDLFFLERKTTVDEFPLIQPPIKTWRLLALSLTILGIFFGYFWVILTFGPFAKVPAILLSFFPILLVLLSYWLFTTQSPLRFFRLLHWRDLKVGIGFLLCQIAYSTIVALLLNTLHATMANRAIMVYQKLPPTAATILYILSDNFGALLFEEIISIPLFLALNAILAKYLKRSTAIGVALVLSSLIFGSLHFYAYNWHLAQMFLIIGVERLFLTGAYIRTRNIWVSFIMHYLLDVVPIVLLVFVHH